ncbi:MAG: hypothetical protein NC418_02255 [Muribaculaceae bacterium]|nr:hypothetical protein [Muribaculaceae bacterium]
MSTLNYKSDLDFTLRLLDPSGASIGWPDFDWEARFYTASKANAVKASSIQGVCIRCFNDNGTIHIVLDSDHHLSPGELKVDFKALLPNTTYPDGTRQVATAAPLGIELVRDGCTCPCGIEAELQVPAYIRDFDRLEQNYGLTLGEINRRLEAILGREPGTVPGESAAVVEATPQTLIAQWGMMPLKAVPGVPYRNLGCVKLRAKPKILEGGTRRVCTFDLSPLAYYLSETPQHLTLVINSQYKSPFNGLLSKLPSNDSNYTFELNNYVLTIGYEISEIDPDLIPGQCLSIRIYNRWWEAREGYLWKNPHTGLIEKCSRRVAEIPQPKPTLKKHSRMPSHIDITLRQAINLLFDNKEGFELQQKYRAGWKVHGPRKWHKVSNLRLDGKCEQADGSIENKPAGERGVYRVRSVSSRGKKSDWCYFTCNLQRGAIAPL